MIVMIHEPTSARFLKARSPLPALISVIAHEVPLDTPTPDALRLQRVDKNNYTLRSNTPMTLESKSNVLHGSYDQVVADICPGLQNILNDFQERHGRITTVNRFLHSEYNGLSDTQLKDLLRLWWQNCGTSPDYSCWYNRGRPCQCLAMYRACGELPLPHSNTIQGVGFEHLDTSHPGLRE